jgi:hypothetical protein
MDGQAFALHLCLPFWQGIALKCLLLNNRKHFVKNKFLTLQQ